MPGKVGRFEVLSEISKSASGAVYKANDPGGSRTVALKTIRLNLPPDLSRILVQLMMREAESTKILNSQNIAALYGLGEIDGQFCAAMEYVEGNSLARMIARQEGFSIWDLLDIGRQVCLALDHANSRGILHRCLEPEKIMMQWDGTVKVLGYGTSTMVSAMPSKPGEVPPLFYYMSPEQVKGDAMDIRSNLFTWGAILYEMVTDQKPFTGPDIQTVRQKILEETPEPPAMINPRIHLGVSRVIMQALSKSPEERYQHGHELMMDLERAKDATQGKPEQSAPPAKGLVSPQKLSGGAPGRGNTSPAVQPTAAAAAAGAGSSGARAGSREPARMSAGAATAPKKQDSNFKTDPMMAEAGSAASKQVSFSDLEEMPPLKEAYVAPEPPPPTASEQKPATTQHFALRPRTVKEYKPNLVTRDNAKKAVKEIKQLPPRLALYSVCAAAGIILLAVFGMWLHFHQSIDADEPAATAAAPAVQRVVPPVQNTQAASAPAATSEDPEVTVTPRFPAAKNKPRVAAPVRPVIIPGELAINSSPEGALVQVDGRSEPGWITPYTLPGVTPGQHTVTIGKPGFSSETRTIQVTSASKSFLAVRLAQIGATLAVTGDPAGALVYVDGKNTGKSTPMQVLVAEKGPHTVLVRKDGYLDETTTVNLVAGQTFHYAPHLRALGITDDIKVVGKFGKLFGRSAQGMMKVSVKTQPKGAQVTANRRMVDKPTPVDFLLNPGNYIIEITMPGYKSVRRVVNVEEGVKLELNETLQPE